MDVPYLMRQLAADDPAGRAAAADALVAMGAAAVEPLLTECVRRSPLQLSDGHRPEHRYSQGRIYATVLQRIGDAAFWPLVGAIAAAERRSNVLLACSAFERLEVSDPAMFRETLNHPHPVVRDCTVRAFAALGEAALAYAPELLPLLADPVSYVQSSTIQALRAMGSDIPSVLRRMRLPPGRHRRAALVALAELGGWDALDEADQRSLQRLTNIKIGYESPEPMHLCGSWFAVPTTDQAAVLDAFGLGCAVPVTMRLGEAAWHLSTHGGSGSLAYVTPALDGWTLVFGNLYRHRTWAELAAEMAALSRRFGAAHHYYVFEGVTGWCLAEQGRIVRSYLNEQPDDQIGPRHPAEADLLLPHERPEPEPEEAMAVQFQRTVNLFRTQYFLRQPVQVTGSHPFDGLAADALPAAFRIEATRFTRFFGIVRAGGWYPDGAFASVELFIEESRRIAQAAMRTGRLDRYLRGDKAPRCWATDVAGRASVDPERLGRHVQVEGHAVLTRCDNTDGSPFSGLQGTLPI